MSNTSSGSSSGPSFGLTEYKASFSKGDFHHFNNAGVAPLCRPAYEAIQNWSKRFYEEGIHCVPLAIAACERTRSSLAAFIGAQAEEIAFFQSAAGAISQVAFGLGLKAGDEVIVWDQEYPSNFYPWRVAAERAGASLVVAQSMPDFSTPISEIERLITPRTRAIGLSWVQYRTGAILDLQALTSLAKSKGIFTCADIIQGVGLLPFDFAASGLDAACGGSHKWLTASVSTGYLAIRKEKLDQLQPLSAGAMSFGDSNDLASLDSKWRPDAKRFEPGSRGMLDTIALGASLEMIEKIGNSHIQTEILRLSNRLRMGVLQRGYVLNSPHGETHRGSIINFSPGSHTKFRTPEQVAEKLTSLKVSFGLRPPGIRMAPHAFNTDEEVDMILSHL